MGPPHEGSIRRPIAPWANKVVEKTCSMFTIGPASSVHSLNNWDSPNRRTRMHAHATSATLRKKASIERSINANWRHFVRHSCHCLRNARSHGTLQSRDCRRVDVTTWPPRWRLGGKSRLIYPRKTQAVSKQGHLNERTGPFCTRLCHQNNRVQTEYLRFVTTCSIPLKVKSKERKKERKKRSVLFNDALNTFYLRLYGVRYMVKDHSDGERGNPQPPHGLLFPISSKGSFICIIQQTG